MTVFDFSTILERTERRVRDDLLGAGPKTVGELRSIAGRLRLKYEAQLERRLQRAMQHQQSLEPDNTDNTAKPKGGLGLPTIPVVVPTPPPLKDVLDKAGGAAGAMAGAAGAFAGGFFAKVKTTGAALGSTLNRTTTQATTATPATTAFSEPAPTIVDLPPPMPFTAPATTTANQDSDGDWVGTDIASATDAISNFSIGDDEDEDMML